jgi:hypothetical protein
MESQDLRSDSRIEAQNNWRSIHWVGLRMFHGREGRRGAWIVRFGRTIETDWLPGKMIDHGK